LQKCTKSPVIINTSRGQLIDEVALINALDKKFISGAALDVYEKEPYNGPLCKREDVLLTPHIASFTKEVREKIEIEAVNNLVDNL
jgi:D-3-phosphoglycerate dehydrogenase